MLVGAVAGIYHRHVGHFGGISCRAFEIVAHHDQIHVVAHHLYGVLEGLSFSRAACARIGEAYDTSAEPVDGRFKAQSCTCGWFEKQCGHNLAFKQTSVGILFEVARRLQKLEYFVAAYIVD